jgi:hypothetical protein
LHAAVLAGLGAVGMAGTANAVQVPEGYTLNYGQEITANYDNYAANKEGQRSAEVLDFKLQAIGGLCYEAPTLQVVVLAGGTG